MCRHMLASSEDESLIGIGALQAVRVTIILVILATRVFMSEMGKPILARIGEQVIEKGLGLER